MDARTPGGAADPKAVADPHGEAMRRVEDGVKLLGEDCERAIAHAEKLTSEKATRDSSGVEHLAKLNKLHTDMERHRTDNRIPRLKALGILSLVIALFAGAIAGYTVWKQAEQQVAVIERTIETKVVDIDYNRLIAALPNTSRATADIVIGELSPQLALLRSDVNELKAQPAMFREEPALEEPTVGYPPEPVGYAPEPAPLVVPAQYYEPQPQPYYAPPGFGGTGVGFNANVAVGPLQAGVGVGVGIGGQRPGYRQGYGYQYGGQRATRGAPNCRRYPGFQPTADGRCTLTRPVSVATPGYAKYAQPNAGCQPGATKNVVVSLPGGGTETIRMRCRYDAEVQRR